MIQRNDDSEVSPNSDEVTDVQLSFQRNDESEVSPNSDEVTDVQLSFHHKKLSIKDFEGENLIGESMLAVSHNELQKLLSQNILVEQFGEDTSRNHPLNEAEVANLTSDMHINGIQSSLLTFTMIADENTCDIIQTLCKETESKRFFKYEDLVQAVEKKNSTWKSVILDGHHRRAALLGYCSSSSLPENVFIRARWLKSGCKPADYRR